MGSNEKEYSQENIMAKAQIIKQDRNTKGLWIINANQLNISYCSSCWCLRVYLWWLPLPQAARIASLQAKCFPRPRKISFLWSSFCFCPFCSSCLALFFSFAVENGIKTFCRGCGISRCLVRKKKKTKRKKNHGSLCSRKRTSEWKEKNGYLSRTISR